MKKHLLSSARYEKRCLVSLVIFFCVLINYPSFAQRTSGTDKITNVSVNAKEMTGGGGSTNTCSVSATGGWLTCNYASVTLYANASAAASYSWTGPNGFCSTMQNPTTTMPGTYTVTATTGSSCTCTDTALVIDKRNGPGVTATGGTITCVDSFVTLRATSPTSGVTFYWTGPNGFTSTSPSPMVRTTGDYTVRATDPSTACSSSDTVTVNQNTAAPVGVTLTASSAITCFEDQITLTANSSTPGVTYFLTGPNGFTSTSQITTTTVPGTYTVTVTDPTNGCRAMATTTVQQNTAHPQNVVATNTGPLTCLNTPVLLIGNSTTPNVSYTWFGPDDYFADTRIASTNVPGEYMLIVTDLTNGCTTTVFTTVLRVCKIGIGIGVGIGSNQKQTEKPGSIQTVSEFTATAYPNPAAGTTYLSFQSPANATVSVAMYNSTGAPEKQLFNGRVEANRLYKVELNTGQLYGGLHYWMIRVDDKMYSVKLIVAK